MREGLAATHHARARYWNFGKARQALARRKLLGYCVRMPYSIMPMTEAYIESFREALDAVARERRYLALLKAPTVENTRKFVAENLREGWPHFVALEGERVIGWCDIHTLQRDIYAHAGVLGMGIVDGHRGQGIGEALMRVTLDAAKAKGLTRVELTVREHNLRAKRLYEKMGFQFEGVKRRGVRVDGQYEDLICMALLFDEKSSELNIV